MWQSTRDTPAHGRVRWSYAFLTAIGVAVVAAACVRQLIAAPAPVDYRSRMRDVSVAAAFEATNPDPSLLPTGREWVTHIEEDLLPY
jgi:hypothetical protein